MMLFFPNPKQVFLFILALESLFEQTANRQEEKLKTHTHTHYKQFLLYKIFICMRKKKLFFHLCICNNLKWEYIKRIKKHNKTKHENQMKIYQKKN